ncbi:hypothetical protein D9756_007138 [Leucocoprinus leucothites]|uniref:F-box domain-containing protein n=1 Tax=Leucocoprinus leucothites TaxID=201217 RepID=A0A8H5D647_9AGAR|nr:hypothetical protein D9756_007138 [Leucoagaricus leucothites]
MPDPQAAALINRLPPETLGEIFSFVPSQGIQLVQRNTYPWWLTFVCKLWRDVVILTPQLWATIIVYLDPLRVSRIDTRGDSLVAAWQLCLERSGDYPLTVTIESTSTDTMSFVQRLLLPLMKHARQWEKMIFGFPVHLLTPFVHNSSLRFPRLCDLMLRGGHHDTPSDLQPPKHQLFPHAPVLSRVQFQEFLYPPSLLKISWAQITELCLVWNDGNVWDLLEVLENTPNLACLTFAKILDSWSTFHRAPRPRDSQALELPQLRRISWRTFSANHFRLFDMLSTPRLVEMEFSVNDIDWQLDVMQRFLHRSRCTVVIARLNISNPRLVESFLDVLPDAEEITLTTTPGDVGLMHALTLGESTSTERIVPKMKKLVLENMPMKAEVHSAFVRMVQSRLPGPDSMKGQGQGSRLVSLDISVYPEEILADFSMASAYQLLRETLPPEEMKLIKYEERRFEDRFR